MRENIDRWFEVIEERYSNIKAGVITRDAKEELRDGDCRISRKSTVKYLGGRWFSLFVKKTS